MMILEQFSYSILLRMSRPRAEPNSNRPWTPVAKIANRKDFCWKQILSPDPKRTVQNSRQNADFANPGRRYPYPHHTIELEVDMVLEKVNKQKTQMRGRVRALKVKPTIEDPAKPNVKRQRFLALLERQYGYTNDKAIDELERLLTQFYRTNKSLEMHRSHPVFRHPRAD
jgi:hypothetical protein